MQQLKLKISGLVTHPSDMSASLPEGALSVADDIVIDKEDTAEPRRGFNKSYGGFSDATYRANKLFFYQNYLFAQFSTNKLGYYTTILDSAAADFTGSGSWSTISGSYAPPTSTKTKAVEANQNFYFTSSVGIYKMDAYNATPVLAGAYKGLDLSVSSAGATSGWLETQYRTAYRVVWGYKDANNNLILGAPSQREAFTNTTSGTIGTTIRATIPDGVTTNWFYQLYRSAQVDNGSNEVEPNDEMGLVYEGNPVDSDISQKYIDISDITPDELRGATIYTAASQEGLAAGNEQPPLGRDIAVYKNAVFCGYTTNKHRYYLTLLAVGGAGGVLTDDTLTIGGKVYTAKTTETIGNREFRAYQAGSFAFVAADVSIADNTITETAHGMQDGDVVILSNSGGALPAGLLGSTTYYVRDKTTDTFKLALTLGGTAVDITGTGSGTQTAVWGGSASQNIRDTALSLVRVINRNSASTVYAYYLSGTDDLPGKILLESRTLGASAFHVGASRAGSWSPSPPSAKTVSSVDTGTEVITSTSHGFSNADAVVFSAKVSPSALPSGLVEGTTYYVRDVTTHTFAVAATSGGAVINLGSGFTATVLVNKITEASTNDELKNGLAFSKTHIPEAFPLTNTFTAGSAQKAILRILPLRDSLFILKEDGIYRLSGEDSGSFRVDLFDSTARLLAPESCAVLNNAIYALTDQGVVSITESGVQVLSRPIEATLLSLQGVNPSVLSTESFGVAYESERKYILFVPRLSGDSHPTQAFVYNTFTNAWTRWVLAKKCGAVNPKTEADRLYLGDASSSYINQERKSYSYKDYVDFSRSVTISAVAGNVVTLSNVDVISKGDVIYQSATVYSIVDSVDVATDTVTTTFAASFALGTADLLTSIPSRVSWTPFSAGNPGTLKQFREVTGLFKTDFTGTGKFLFSSEASPARETEELEGTAVGNWGLFVWGEVPWGGSSVRRPFRVWVPRNKQRCAQLIIEFRHSTGYAAYQLNGLSIIFNAGSERVSS